MTENNSQPPGLFTPILDRIGRIVIASVVVGAVAVGLSYLIRPSFTAKTAFLPPQQSQSAAMGALASLGSLAALAGGSMGISSPIDQYLSLLQSETISDRILQKFDLQKLYEEELRTDALRVLSGNVRVSAGKRDGIIRLEVDDHSPQRAADMANQYVAELRTLLATLALTEAQRRRQFLEIQLQEAKGKLADAQTKLQASGFNTGVLRAEPKAAAETYARLKAELTAAQIQLAALQNRFRSSAPEVRQQQAVVSALSQQLREQAVREAPPDPSGYIDKYREFKYQETMFEMLARQYELARIDESREGVSIQVIDEASAPERKSKPKRAVIGILTTATAFVLISGWVLVRHRKQRHAAA
jgi:uncharacterized protein involved in exopolysaccharide biosynthesis